MNRWSKWTRQLRARHARTERSGGAGMVFQRRLAGGSSLVQRIGSRMQISVNPRIGITLMASAAAPLPAMRTLTQTSHVRHQHSNTQLVHTTLVQPLRHVPGQQAAEPVREGSIDRVRTTETTFLRTLPRFIPAAVRQAMESDAPRIHRMSQGVLQQFPVVRAAKELPAQFRLRARREELRPSEMPQIVNVARAASAAPAAIPGAQLEQDSAMKATHPVLPPQPTPPPLNVEALTSQVIQQIDRRLIAYRERMGRG